MPIVKPTKRIRTAEDYKAALRRVSELMELADELDVLSLLVADYEAKHWSVMPPDPIEAGVSTAGAGVA